LKTETSSTSLKDEERKKPKTRKQNAFAEQLKVRVLNDRLAIKNHLISVLIGLTDVCRQPDIEIQKLIAL
jgi:hypothetical protein